MVDPLGGLSRVVKVLFGQASKLFTSTFTDIAPLPSNTSSHMYVCVHSCVGV